MGVQIPLRAPVFISGDRADRGKEFRLWPIFNKDKIFSATAETGFLYLPSILVKNEFVKDESQAIELLDEFKVRIHALFKIRGTRKIVVFNEQVPKGKYWVRSSYLRNCNIDCGTSRGSRKLKF